MLQMVHTLPWLQDYLADGMKYNSVTVCRGVSSVSTQNSLHVSEEVSLLQTLHPHLVQETNRARGNKLGSERHAILLASQCGARNAQIMHVIRQSPIALTHYVHHDVLLCFTCLNWYMKRHTRTLISYYGVVMCKATDKEP